MAFAVANLAVGGAFAQSETGTAPERAPETARGPTLSAASNLAQGRQRDVIRFARALGVGNFRDGINWRRAEPRPGAYDFSDSRTGYPATLKRQGATAGVVLNWGNPLYDGGDTPHSEEALEAFGAFAAELVGRFEAISSLEIGNEFNGTNFVRGPIAKMSPLERARAYVPMLEAGATAARAERPDIRILGGATHSLPAGYLWEMLDAGAAEWMDALAVHPYTTPAEQLVRQIEVLRRHPTARDLPIEVTEFGTPDPELAGAHFVRNYCQMALAGVTRAAWYPLNERGDDMVPLFTSKGRITTAGRAYKLIATHMEGRPVADAAPDPFTYGCRFGEDVLVLWGEPRALEVPEGAVVLDAVGQPAEPPYTLSPDRPLVVTDLPPGAASNLGPQPVLADSYHQFAYPQDGGAASVPDDPFERFARRGGREIPLKTLPGQQAPGTPWVPYRGNPDLGAVRLTADTLLPGGWSGRPVEIVHRYTAPEAMVFDLDATFALIGASEDGIALRVTANGELLEEASGRDPIEIRENDIRLEAGESLEIAVGPNGSSKGDVTRYQITIRR